MCHYISEILIRLYLFLYMSVGDDTTSLYDHVWFITGHWSAAPVETEMFNQHFSFKVM